MQSLSGIGNLNTIGGFFDIADNTTLTSITALQNLTSIGAHLKIWNNDLLTDLNGLENINPNSITDLFIRLNNTLSTCEVQSICDYIANPAGAIDIADNASGCNNQAEVEAACGIVSIENMDIRNQISIFPNPVEMELFITNNNGVVINELIIYNQVGQKVMHETRLPDVIDVSMLRQGMYIIILVLDEEVVRKKLMIR